MFSGTVSTLGEVGDGAGARGRKTVKVRSAMWQSGGKASCSSSPRDEGTACASERRSVHSGRALGPVVPDV
jgi:hypothetical protein